MVIDDKKNTVEINIKRGMSYNDVVAMLTLPLNSKNILSEKLTLKDVKRSVMGSKNIKLTFKFE